MKKRVLSALLALSTLLTTAPAAYAAEPATQSDGAEIDWPEPTCTVDYTPQSDTVSCEFVEETGDAPADHADAHPAERIDGLRHADRLFESLLRGFGADLRMNVKIRHMHAVQKVGIHIRRAK